MGRSIQKQIVIGIESSCDDSCLAVVNLNGEVLFNKTVSQLEMHNKFGGVVPEIASRNHVINIQQLYLQMQMEPWFNKANISAICATIGPGLIGGLIVSSMFAKGLASGLNVPFIGVNHLEAHILSAKIDYPTLEFPFLALLVSGGNSQIVLAKGLSNYIVLGKTLDDAAGEAFDKIGRELGLAYPAGKQIDELAQKGNPKAFNIATPMCSNNNGLNMSFSGLKTSALTILRNTVSPNLEDYCASVQYAIVKTLGTKLQMATRLPECVGITSIALCGGVAANSSLRSKVQQIAENINKPAIIPPPKYCTDNAPMIAITGLQYLLQDGLSKINSLASKPISMFPLGEGYAKS